MRAECTKPFAGRRDNEPNTTNFEKGDILEGELAEAAVGMKVAKKLKDEPKPAEEAPAEAPAEEPAKDAD